MTPEKLRELEALRDNATRDRSENEHDFLRARVEYAKALDLSADNLFAAARERDELKRKLEALEEAMYQLNCPGASAGTIVAIAMLKDRADQILKERSK